MLAEEAAHLDDESHEVPTAVHYLKTKKVIALSLPNLQGTFAMSCLRQKPAMNKRGKR